MDAQLIELLMSTTGPLGTALAVMFFWQRGRFREIGLMMATFQADLAKERSERTVLATRVRELEFLREHEAKG